MTCGYYMPVVELRAGLGELDSPAGEAYLALCEQFLLPLLRMLERLEDDGCDYGLTLAFPPALLSWFEQAPAAERLARRLRERVRCAEELLANDTSRKTLRNPDASPAEAWLERCRDLLYWHEAQYGRRLGKALQRLASFGHLELMTTTATHCALPLLRSQPGALRAQIRAATDEFCVAFGTHPKGIWLPGGCYFPGLEAELQSAGLQYCFARPEAFQSAEAPLPVGLRAPVLADSALAVFAPDPALTAPLCGQAAFCNDGDYLDAVALFRCASVMPTTPNLARNRAGKPWDPAHARRKADQHAAHYLAFLQQQLSVNGAGVVASGGAFWSTWPEGIEFLDYLLRKSHYDQKQVRITTPGAYLAQPGLKLQRARPGEASAPDHGLFCDYYEHGADALLPELHLAASTMRGATGSGRLLRQMGRELLLAQEWREDDPAGSHRDARRHLARFTTLDQARTGNATDQPEQTELLTALESDTPLFAYLDTRHFQD